MTTSVMSVAEADGELNELILSGRALEGLERFYADDVVMREHRRADPRQAGQPRARGGVLRQGRVGPRGEGPRRRGRGDVPFSEWTFDVNLKGGQRVRLDQVSVRRWKDGRIVHERFYYEG